MLQQTTVQTVIPYFERFMKVFPTLESLANSSLDDVYVVWQGLGYYSRAKNLHKAAQQIVALGCFPHDLVTLKTLAGVGDYTSAAVAAIAFDQPVVPIDGNVMRVMSRLFQLEVPKGKELYAQTEKYVDVFAGAADNSHSAQALMELGALVCRPKQPACTVCPLAENCLARQNKMQDKLPIQQEKIPKPKRTAITYVVSNEQGQLMLVRRPPKGLFANMYIFPTTTFGFDADLLSVLIENETNKLSIKHVFTHFELQLTVVQAKLNREGAFPSTSLTVVEAEGDRVRWVHKVDLGKYAMPSLMKKVIKTL